MKQLGMRAREVVAFEDSLNGLLAAKAAGLKTVCIPEPSAWQDPRFGIANCKLRSMEKLSGEHFQAFSMRS